MRKEKMTAVFAMIIALFGSMHLIGEEVVTSYNFDKDPAIKTFTVNLPDGRSQMLKTVLPFSATEGQSFAAEISFNLSTFNHYGRFAIGLTDGKNQEIMMEFFRGDDRIARCQFIARLMKGVEQRIKPYEDVPKGVKNCFIEYDASKKTLVFTLKNDQNKDLYVSAPVKLRGKVNLNAFCIGVQQNLSDPSSELSYDEEAGALFCRSYVGVEGEYPYMIEATVTSLTINAEKKAATPEKAAAEGK